MSPKQIFLVFILILIIFFCSAKVERFNEEPQTVYVCEEVTEESTGTEDSEREECLGPNTGEVPPVKRQPTNVCTGEKSKVKNQKKPNNQSSNPSNLTQSNQATNQAKTSGKCQIEKGTNYYGPSYQTVTKASPEECCHFCGEQLQCLAWTYDKEKQECRLKDELPTEKSRFQCPNKVSGTITGRTTVQKEITLFSGPNFTGEQFNLLPGFHSFTSLGWTSKTLGSIQIPPGYQVTLFQNEHFTGVSRTYLTDVSYVGNTWEQQTRGIQVFVNP